MKRLIYLVLAFLVFGCSSPQTSPTGEVERSTSRPADYNSLISHWTQKEQGYNNFSQSFQAAATLLSRELTEEQVNFDGRKFNWTNEQVQENRTKTLYDLQTQTTFFVSIYTERDEDNNLDKSNSVWNLYLDLNGKRVTPQSVKRVYENKAVLNQKYPFINVWSRNYYVKFPVPTDEATNAKPVFTLAGPFGIAHLKYSPR